MSDRDAEVEADVEVELRGVTKRFAPRDGDKDKGGAGAVLRDLSLSVRRGELCVLVGPSGCGKSTTLRIVAGLEEADVGSVTVGGRAMDGVAPQDRDVAMVFQGYALYPQMTARENIEFPLKMRKVPPAERRARSDEAARMLKIERLLDRLPGELSGGERQRVAMGRAIVRRPRVFLFDEPLSNLDAALRGDLRLQIGELVRTLGATAIYVTHDHVEAMTLADRICVMHKGVIEQLATPREIYERPATSFVATFIGAPRMNLVDGRVDGAEIVFGPFRLPRPAAVTAEDVVVGLRPEALRVTEPDAEGAAVFEVVACEPLGAETHLVLRAAELELRARVEGFALRDRGARVGVIPDASSAHVFGRAAGGRRLG